MKMFSVGTVVLVFNCAADLGKLTSQRLLQVTQTPRQQAQVNSPSLRLHVGRTHSLSASYKEAGVCHGQGTSVDFRPGEGEFSASGDFSTVVTHRFPSSVFLSSSLVRRRVRLAGLGQRRCAWRL